MSDASSFSFTKMHGLGNDFVFLDARTHPFLLSPAFIKCLSDRQRGIGCDQVIVLDKPTHSQCTVDMRIFNADGAEVGACGNGTRCLGAYLARQTHIDHHFIQSKDRVLETQVTPKGVKLTVGKPVLDWRHIPLAKEVDPLFLPLSIEGMDLPVAVGMGNPHLIFFVKNLDAIDVTRWGRELTQHPLFPEGTNVEFVHIINRNQVRMRVWERGAGLTQSCATGACAVVVAGVLRGVLDKDMTVTLDGGDLFITYHDDVTVEGPVSFVFDGRLDPAFNRPVY